MLSRLSAFSGPLSKLFSTLKGFTLDGLILRYEISNTSSYGGTSSVVNDLVSNSNATLLNGPTYSINGYLNFDGNNDYLMTNTSLNSKLSPVNTSTVISYFVWIYPQDNGVIVSEHGSFQSPESPTTWHYSPIEMVSGSLKFGIWIEPGGVGSISSLTSSISTPINRWYYVGITYDGTIMRAYVDGQLAGSKTLTRAVPNTYGFGLHYAVGSTDSTNMGDGTYAKMKFGAFHVYKTALSQQQVTNNYNATKSDYIYTGSMSIWIDANDPQSYASGTSITDLSGNGYTHSLVNSSTSLSIFGMKCFDCSSGTKWIYSSITGPTLSNSGYTYVSWARIIPSSSSYRTLYRTTPDDHPLLINVGTDTLGVYDNSTNAFYSSGYNISSIEEKWVQWSVVGDSNGSEFYINDTLVGTSSVSSSGNRHNWIGNITGGQAFGYIGNTMLYDKKLTQAQIKQNYDALKHVYSNGDFVIDNLLLHFNPASHLSYPGSGSIVTDLTINSLNGTMSNITYGKTYFGFGGTNSQIAIGDNSLLEPGSGNWSIETWVNQATYSSESQTILGKFDPGGLTADISYAIRIANNTGNVRCDFSNGSVGVSTSNYTLSLNTWYQLVYVFDNVSNNIITYVNGTSYSTTVNNNVNSILNTTANLYLGSYNNGEYPQWFNGKMGIVRIYNSALSASDVSKNFEANRDIYGI